MSSAHILNGVCLICSRATDDCSCTVEQAEAHTAHTARIAEARERGTAAGKAAASWVFDGNTSDATYRALLKGLEEGDPEVLDRYSWSPLSGEWAGESIIELLDDLLEGTDPDEQDELCDEYEEAATAAYWDELELRARAMVGGPEEDE